MLSKLILSLILSICSLGLTAAGHTQDFRQEHYDNDDGLPGTLIGGGVQDRNGLLWFATWNGLICYDGYEFHRVAIEPGDGASIGTNHIRDILMSDEGDIICHTDYGIFKFDLTGYSFSDIDQGRTDSLKNLLGRRWKGLTDTQGNIWTADSRGLYKNYIRQPQAEILEGTEGENPRAFTVDRAGRLLVGLRKRPGINIYDPERRLTDHIDLDNAPYCIFQGSDDDIWIGSKPYGLQKVGGKNIAAGDAVYDIREDSRGRLWIATFGNGIKCCVNPREVDPQLSASFGAGKIRKIFITPDDYLIAATDEGILVGSVDEDDISNIKFRKIERDGNRRGSLCSNAILSVGGDRNGNIYLCSESSGIDMIHYTGLMDDKPEFKHFNMSNSSLSDDICNGMTVVSDSLVVIVGRNHIMALDPANDNTVNFSRTFWGDSCDFNECTPLRLSDGNWLFGASQGVYLASWQKMDSRDYIPPMIFTKLSINDGAPLFSLPPKEELKLAADERNVTITYAALDYIDNENILYRTRLDDLPWTGGSPSRSVTLFDLSPGTHQLEVQSTDRYGRWVDNNRILTIIVAPFWYETWWFRILTVIFVLGLISGIVYTYIYIKQVNRHRKELLEKYMALINTQSEREQDESGVSPKEADTPTLFGQQKEEDNIFLNRVRSYVEENLSNPDANIDDMAAATATSRSTLNRHLRSQLGITAAQLLIEARIKRAEHLLLTQADLPVDEIAARCGYSDVYYFQRVFKKKNGMTPAEYRSDKVGC